MTDHLKRLYAHLEWADQRILACLEQLPAPPAVAVGLFAHVIAAEHVWLARVRDDATPAMDVWATLSLAECRLLLAQAQTGFGDILATSAETDLLRSIVYRNSKGTAFQTPLGDILLHVAMHGSYHRGQVATHLRLGGFEPVNTDFITFARE